MDKKHLTILISSTIIAAFFGAYIASWLFHKRMEPQLGYFVPTLAPMTERSFEQAEKIIEHQQKIFDEDFDDIFDNDIDDRIEYPPMPKRPFFVANDNIKAIETKNQYKILINLKPFNNDEKNIDTRLKGKTIYIFGKYKSKDPHNFHAAQIYEAIQLPDNANMSALEQEKEDNVLVLSVPKK